MKRFNATASYSLLQGSMWAFYAILLGYSSSFLYSCGFGDGQISLVLGIATAISCVLQLGLSELISRIPKLTLYRVLLFLGGLILLSSFAMTDKSRGALAITGLAAGCAILQALPAMGNAVGIVSMDNGSPIIYGVSRGIGSASYSLLALITGQAVGKFGSDSIALIAIADAAVFIISVLWFHYAGEIQADSPKEEKEDDREVFQTF